MGCPSDAPPKAKIEEEMKVLALDLDTNYCGIAILDHNLRLIKRKLLTLSGKTEIQKMIELAFYIYSIKGEIDEVVIEDTFMAKNPKTFKHLSRLAGAVEYLCYRKFNKEAHFIMARQARGYSELKGNCKKIETQLKIAKEYGLVDDKIFYKYHGKIGNLYQQYKDKKITKGQFDYRADKKFSEEFTKETGLDNHSADAIVLARALISKLKEK